MDESKPTKDELMKDLRKIENTGVTAERQRLKEDMCAQFRDYREWIREYVVNAYDAHSKHCWISGREEGNIIWIKVKDDGHGMDRQGVLDFFTLFRSVKVGERNVVVGRHGVGKLSVAAIPGQCGFRMRTSTGEECWKMETGRLLDDKPIHVQRISRAPTHGTTFEIGFEGKAPLHEELQKLGDVLYRYVKYLPMNIVISGISPDTPNKVKPIRWIRGDWGDRADRYMRTYRFKRAGNEFEAVLSIGRQSHEVYQNRVLVSDSYNLLSIGLRTNIYIPHLKIRLDSPDFELPFGRHCLSNEEILQDASQHLRKTLLVEYFKELINEYQTGEFWAHEVIRNEFEDIICSLISNDQIRNGPWISVPVFNVHNRPRMSFSEISKEARALGKLYLAASEDIGADYKKFDAPVISASQPSGGIDLIKNEFSKELLNLAQTDMVLEAPPGTAPAIGPKEKRFQDQLGFHGEIPAERKKENELDVIGLSGGSNAGSNKYKVDMARELEGVCEESQLARGDLESIRWRVSYLVERDGKTPCKSHLFLFKSDHVTLNLNHPEVQHLLKLSEKAPDLAGHLGLAMCLTANNKILPHLTPEAREDLIMIDAMARCSDKHSKRGKTAKDIDVSLDDLDIIGHYKDLSKSKPWLN